MNRWKKLVATLAMLVAVAAPALARSAPDLGLNRTGSGAEETPGVPEGIELPGTASAPAWGGPPSWAGRAFTQGVVSTNHRLASEAGARILEQGGNAVDAAVAVAFALNVVEPQNSGIGGAAQILVYLARGEAWAVDGREQAPAAATPDQLVGKTDYGASGIAVAVPGSLRAAETALRLYGTRTLAEVLQPAIELAEKGFPVSPALARGLAGAKVSASREAIAVFRHADGTPLAAGEWLVQPLLARTLRLIAEQGSHAFYRGEIAPAIVAAVRARARLPGYEGRVTLADLAAYDVTVRRPLVARYRGVDVVSFPPSSPGGLVVLETLLTLERFPLGNASAGFGAGSFRTVNALVEAARLAHADRAWWGGDDRFVPVPTAGLLSDAYTAERSALIDPDGRLATAPAGDPLRFETAAHPEIYGDPGGIQTTHFSIADRHGNLVSYTTTLADGFGTGIFVPGYGFFLNNSGIKFNRVPQLDPAAGNPGANDAAPGKRPGGFMAPTILASEGRPFAALGSPGGGTIPTTVIQIVSNLLDHGLDVQAAIDAPRIAYNEGGTFGWEAAVPAGTIAELRAVGQRIAAKPGNIGSVQAVVVDLRTGKQYGGADRRAEGFVLGLPRPQGGGNP